MSFLFSLFPFLWVRIIVRKEVVLARCYGSRFAERGGSMIYFPVWTVDGVAFVF